MQEQIHKELAVLQNELSQLDSAVTHIQNAERLAQSVVNTGTELQAKYDDQISEVQILIAQYQELTEKAEKVIQAIDQVDFPNRLDKLESLVAGINLGLQNTQLKLENISHEISGDLKDINKSLDEVITGIAEGLQHTQLKIEESSHKIIDDMKVSKNDLDKKMESNRKRIKILMILASTGIALAAAILIRLLAPSSIWS